MYRLILILFILILIKIILNITKKTYTMSLIVILLIPRIIILTVKINNVSSLTYLKPVVLFTQDQWHSWEMHDRLFVFFFFLPFYLFLKLCLKILILHSICQHKIKSTSSFLSVQNDYPFNFKIPSLFISLSFSCYCYYCYNYIYSILFNMHLCLTLFTHSCGSYYTYLSTAYIFVDKITIDTSQAA